MSDVTTELANEANDKAMEIARLKAENAKLREQVERLRTQLADMTESVGRVEERCAKTFEVGKRWMAKAARFEAENAKLRKLLRGWQVYAVDNTFGDIYKSEDVVDSNVVTFCDKHGYRLYTSMEVYGLLHDPNANERILTHDELPETIPCSEVFADIDV